MTHRAEASMAAAQLQTEEMPVFFRAAKLKTSAPGLDCFSGAMKRFKVKYDPQEEVGLRAKRDPKKKLEVFSIEAYDLDTNLPLRTHVEAIYRLVSPLDNTFDRTSYKNGKCG